MRIAITQTVHAPPEKAIAAYSTPAFFDGRPTLDDITVVEVVSHDATSVPILMEVRFAFQGNVSSAVRAVVDPSKMTWVTRTEIHPGEGRSSWKVLPDHYPDRLSAHGTYTFEPGPEPGTTHITIQGELKVHMPLVGRTVERVIVSGLTKYIEAEVASIPDLGR